MCTLKISNQIRDDVREYTACAQQGHTVFGFFFIHRGLVTSEGSTAQFIHATSQNM